MKEIPPALSHIVIAVLTLVLSLSRVAAEPRVFTSNDGRTISAELLSADATNVTLKLADGRESVVPVTRLSAVDQEYAKSWIKGHPSAIRYAFTIDWSREHLGSKSTSPGFKTIIETSQSDLICRFKITNRATVPLEGVGVHVRLYEKTLSGQDRYMDFDRTIEKMAAGQTLDFESDPLTLQATQFKGGSHTSGGVTYVYTTKGPLHNADSLRGFSATVTHAGKEVYTMQSSGFKDSKMAAPR